MKVKTTLLSGLAIISSQLSHASYSELTVSVGDLDKHGLLPSTIQDEFYNLHKIDLNWDEYLKVSKEDEGKNIRFETYDHFSIIVPIADAHGVGNKDL